MPMMSKNFLIGGLAGAFSRTMTAPLELSKIQRQNSYMPHSTLRAVWEKEGIRGLWKGNFANCVRIFPQMAINFMMFEWTKPRVAGAMNGSIPVPLVNFTSGAVAGMTAMLAIYPLENVRSRLALQTNKDHYKGVADVVRKTPIRQLYNGLAMSMMGFAPYNALNFMFYNACKERMIQGNTSKQEAPWMHLLCGGFSGTAAVTITYPTDVIRRRLQLQGFDEKVPRYTGIVHCVRKMWRCEGVRGLYGGLLQCYIKIFPTIALQFWMIETLKKMV